MENKKIIIVYGAQGSGKSTVVNKLVSDSDFAQIGGLRKVRRITTRAYRGDEVPGTDLLHVSESEFDALSNKHELVSEVRIETGSSSYRHGATYQDFAAEGNIVVDMNPEGIAHLEAKAKEQGWTLFKIFVHSNDLTRRERMLKREVSPIQTPDLTDSEYMMEDMRVEGRMSRDTNPTKPYAEGEADLVLENVEGDFDEMYAKIKESVLHFLETKEPTERSLELRNNR